MFAFEIISIYAGWIDAYIVNENNEMYYPTASYLNDTPKMLLENLNNLAVQQNGSCVVNWQREPGAHIWHIRKEEDIVYYSLYRPKDMFDWDINEFTVDNVEMFEKEFNGSTGFVEFYRVIVEEMAKYSHGDNLELYNREWSCGKENGLQFPVDEFNKAVFILNQMKIRIAETDDIERILSVLESGREFLHSQGLSQWQNGYGPAQYVEEDIANNWGFVLLSHDIICGYAALIEGVDECYTNIKDGCWDNSHEKYISIHSVAIDANFRGKKLAEPFMRRLIEIAKGMNYHDIRIDTHPLNEIMQKVILRSGFVYKGIVEFNIPDGKRKGYQLICKN